MKAPNTELFALMLWKHEEDFGWDIIDTNNFTLRTTANTFRCATYLLSNGADTVKVQYLLKQDIKKFIKKQKLLSNIEIINKTGRL